MQPPSHQVRSPVQAGRFYPASPASLGRAVERFLQDARGGRTANPKGVIAPHAGYTYSGPIAGSALAPWAAGRSRIRRVILLGPSHWFDFRGLALPEATALGTPLGTVPVDVEAIRMLEGLPQVRVLDEAHAREHCLEVELPFLQLMLAEFAVVPLVVGRASDGEVEAVVNRLWGGDETRFVISSDLSHYLPYAEAQRIDRFTADSVERLEAAALTAQHACGYRPVRAFLDAARAHGLEAGTADLRNSGDTAGPRDEVVGYGAFHFGRPEVALSSA